MTQENLRDRIVFGSMPQFGESTSDYRERMALLQSEALKRRQQELHEQSSPLNTPSDRIRIWERLHQLELPRSPSHALIAIIATNTGLSTEDVHAEQRMRAAPPAAPAPLAVPDPAV
jgi:hypothetical protein